MEYPWMDMKQALEKLELDSHHTRGDGKDYQALGLRSKDLD